MLLNDASPRFESVTRRWIHHPDSPLREAWTIANRTGGVAPVVNEDGTPYGLITGPSLFAFSGQMVGPHPRKQEMRIKDILDNPASEACNTKVPRFQTSYPHPRLLQPHLREEGDDFWVVDESGAMWASAASERFSTRRA
jgi:manganese-dependent inorganic pyrophosphatase